MSSKSNPFTNVILIDLQKSNIQLKIIIHIQKILEFVSNIFYLWKKNTENEYWVKARQKLKVFNCLTVNNNNQQTKQVWPSKTIAEFIMSL